MNLRPRIAHLLVCVCLAAAAAGSAQSVPKTLTVFAASDLGPAFGRLVPLFEATSGDKVTLVLGSSGTLAQQIRNGAPADLYFAANESFVNDLASDGAIVPHSRVRYAQGQVVMVTLKSSAIRVDSLKDLTDARIRRVAIANPAHAPYGLAARQALESTSLWKIVEPKLVFGESVQQALQFVRSGSADAGIVARSIVGSTDLSWTLVDSGLHAPLNQMAAIVARSKQQDLAHEFLAFLDGTRGRAVMRDFGFLPPIPYM